MLTFFHRLSHRYQPLVVGNPAALWFLSFTRFFLFQFLCSSVVTAGGFDNESADTDGYVTGVMVIFLILLMHCWVFYFNFNQLLKYINEGCLRCRLNFVR